MCFYSGAAESASNRLLSKITSSCAAEWADSTGCSGFYSPLQYTALVQMPSHADFLPLVWDRWAVVIDDKGPGYFVTAFPTEQEARDAFDQLSTGYVALRDYNPHNPDDMPRLTLGHGLFIDAALASMNQLFEQLEDDPFPSFYGTTRVGPGNHFALSDHWQRTITMPTPAGQTTTVTRSAWLEARLNGKRLTLNNYLAHGTDEGVTYELAGAWTEITTDADGHFLRGITHAETEITNLDHPDEAKKAADARLSDTDPTEYLDWWKQ